MEFELCRAGNRRLTSCWLFTPSPLLQGRLAAEAEAHTRAVADRDRHVRQVAADVALGASLGAEASSGAPLSPAALAAFSAAFAARLADAAAAVEAAKATNRAADDDRGAALDKARARGGCCCCCCWGRVCGRLWAGKMNSVLASMKLSIT